MFSWIKKNKVFPIYLRSIGNLTRKVIGLNISIQNFCITLEHIFFTRIYTYLRGKKWILVSIFSSSYRKINCWPHHSLLHRMYPISFCLKWLLKELNKINFLFLSQGLLFFLEKRKVLQCTQNSTKVHTKFTPLQIMYFFTREKRCKSNF